jgi:hypothetical protein
VEYLSGNLSEWSLSVAALAFMDVNPDKPKNKPATIIQCVVFVFMTNLPIFLFIS